MKVFTENGVYVQYADLLNLDRFNDFVPKKIKSKIYIMRLFGLLMPNEHSYFLFRNNDEIAFFKSQNFIIDLDSIRHMDDISLWKLVNQLQNEKDEAVECLKRLVANHSHTTLAVRAIETTEYKMRTILDYTRNREINTLHIHNGDVLQRVLPRK